MAKLTDLNWCVAKPDSFGLYNLYVSQEAAAADLVRLHAERPGEYDDAAVMLFDDWEYRRSEALLSPGLNEIDSEAYWYALEVLPPLQWHEGDGVNRFCMSEFTSGNITNQYATIKRNGVERFFVKPVRFNDRSTYITEQLIRSYDADQARERSTRPGDEAAIYAEETGCDYATALVRCNMD